MNKISADLLAKRACVYIRQSTPGQVQNNLESQRLQYALVDRARQLGWAEVDVVDEDLGCTASGIHRPGFERMLGSVCEGKIGAIFSIEASRLARTGRDWHTLLEFCGVVGVLLIDADGIYDPRQINDRLVLGMKGTISEMEVATFRQRAQSALEQKAKRGELFRRVRSVMCAPVRIGSRRIQTSAYVQPSIWCSASSRNWRLLGVCIAGYVNSRSNFRQRSRARESRERFRGAHRVIIHC